MGRWYRLRHRHVAIAVGNSYSLCPKITASILESKRPKRQGHFQPCPKYMGIKYLVALLLPYRYYILCFNVLNV